MGIQAQRDPVSGANRRVALVVSRYNEEITSELVAGARAALIEAGVAEDDIYEYHVAGAFELAPACRQVVAVGPEVDALVALGAVIRGQTPHFDFVAGQAAAGIQQVALSSGVPATFGVITALDEAQAWERAGGEVGNRGREAAVAAIEMAAFVQGLHGGREAHGKTKKG